MEGRNDKRFLTFIGIACAGFLLPILAFVACAGGGSSSTATPTLPDPIDLIHREFGGARTLDDVRTAVDRALTATDEDVTTDNQYRVLSVLRAFDKSEDRAQYKLLGMDIVDCVPVVANAGAALRFSEAAALCAVGG